MWDAASMFERGTVVGGVFRWNSNGRVPPQDVLEKLVAGGFPVDYAASMAEKNADLDAFLASQKSYVPSREEEAERMFELRAAFGEGATVVNVLTGRRTVVR